MRLSVEERIAAIKRVWRPGDTGRAIARKLHWPYGTVAHNFYAHREALLPCKLEGDARGIKKVAATASPIVRELFDVIDRLGLTYQEVSNRSGVSRPTLTRYKHGKHSPRVLDIEDIAQVLGYELKLERKKE